MEMGDLGPCSCDRSEPVFCKNCKYYSATWGDNLCYVYEETCTYDPTVRTDYFGRHIEYRDPSPCNISNNCCDYAPDFQTRLLTKLKRLFQINR